MKERDFTSDHCSQVCHDLRHCLRVGRKIVLVHQHCGIQILRAMRLPKHQLYIAELVTRGSYCHEVEPRHQENKIGQKGPMSLKNDTTFGQEGAGQITLLVPHRFSLLIRLRLGEAKAKDDN